MLQSVFVRMFNLWPILPPPLCTIPNTMCFFLPPTFALCRRKYDAQIKSAIPPRQWTATFRFERNSSFLFESTAIIFSPFLRPANYSLNIEICCLMRTIWELSGFLLCRFVAYILCDSRAEILANEIKHNSTIMSWKSHWDCIGMEKKVHVCRIYVRRSRSIKAKHGKSCLRVLRCDLRCTWVK